jgi:C4-dicarboxylate-specific signal transduction histidine kinase
MNFQDTTGLVAALLQLAVAGYALRLNLVFGSKRAGWWLFCAFSLLALAHGLLSVKAYGIVVQTELKGDLLYALLSLLLLVVLAYLEALLRRRRQFDLEIQRSRAELESRIRDKTQELTTANEQLRKTAASLAAEVAVRKRMQEEAEQTHKEMLEVSRLAGMSEVATGVLHNVGNVLNSVNVSAALVADHLADFNIENIARVANLMSEHATDLSDYLTNDPKGRRLPGYLTQLALHLSSERDLLLDELRFVRTKIDHIKEIVATQQNYGKVCGLTESVRVKDLLEDALRFHVSELQQHQVRVKREYDSGLSEIVVDKHKALQILLNLVSNAKHACLESGPKPKQVTIRATRAAGSVRVAMIDNGVGIPAANLNKIFNHGFTTRKKSGHGFGLHSCALAAREMGGSLVARSDGPGTGATFTLELPLRPHSNACTP